ncbi:MAG: cation-transporting P-type ATPase [Chloroflexi bacterium]|nr:cation-transporting P-type ATPase [Chloroflexota bacterium]
MQVLLGKHWHHLTAENAIQLLETNLETGLDIFEVGHRQERFGPNILTAKPGKSPLVRFLLQFNNPLVYVLLAATAITAYIKDPIDALTILAVVIVNAIIGFVQESKAEKAIEALAQAMGSEATVLRAGRQQRIAAAELVPGDVVYLKAGDKVPADLRLVRSRDLQVAEAALTGESVAVQKAAELELSPETILAERRNMAYASTLVTYGQGTGLVTAIGDGTEVGRISSLISSAADLQTPLTRKIASFSRVLLYAILVLAAISFVVGIVRGNSAVDMFLTAVALTVGLIPESLPAVVTITLAIGVSRMAQRRAIVRKLPAVETLGSVTVICSDKTGTLTQNEMTVQDIAAGGELLQVTGAGYAPMGQILSGSEPASPNNLPALRQVLLAGLLCNDSALAQAEGRWVAQGDPTEVALLVAARKAGLDAESLSKEWPRLDSIPFESQHQYMATLHDAGPDRMPVIYVKGAVEAILERCSGMLDRKGNRSALDPARVMAQSDDMARRGLRVLAFASGEMPRGATRIDHRDISVGLVFIGLQGMIDPPRPEAIAAVRACQNAGIQVKMITGDHALTASAIANQIGLYNNPALSPDAPSVLTGKDIALRSDTELVESAGHVAVYARVSPEQKLRLVEAHQNRGEIVAMTGDGVNDAPALKQANIGVAMGITGTDVAKEAADVVLTDDNFASIEAAVEEGRGVFDNLTKFITWTLPTNLGEGLVLIAAIFAGVTLPILPVQILWINLVTASLLGITLALEPKEPGIMARPPRRPDAPLLTGELLLRVLLVSAIILVGAFGLFEWELAQDVEVAVARTVVVNAIVMIELFYLFNARSLRSSMFQIGLFTNPWALLGIGVMLALQLGFTYLPIMNRFFASAPISWNAWWRIIVASLLGYLIIELEKWLRRRFSRAS